MAKIALKNAEKSNNEAEKEYLSRQALAEISGLRISTIKYYSEIGLLLFEQEGEGLNRKFPKDESMKRLKEIQKLKAKRFTIGEIKEKLDQLFPIEKTK